MCNCVVAICQCLINFSNQSYLKQSKLPVFLGYTCRDNIIYRINPNLQLYGEKHAQICLSEKNYKTQENC